MGLCLCLILTAAALCFWHFWMEGRYSLERVDRVTGTIVWEYEKFEAGIPAREELLKTYEDLGKELKRLEEELADLDPQQVEKEVTWARVRTQELQRARDKVQETRDSRARSVSDIKSYIAEYNRALAEAERKIENTDKEKNNELKSQIDALQKELSMWNGWKNATDDELWKFRRTKTIREGRFEERKARVDELNASITAACAQRDAIPYEAIREEMQRHEADEANYRAARHLRWELKLVVPVFGALLLCALAALVLGILRRTKAAVFTGWITAGAWAVGIVALASLVNSVGAGYDEYGYGWYGGYEPVPSPLALPIAALLLGALALWWDRKRTVFRVVHTTGEFFCPQPVFPGGAEGVRGSGQGHTGGRVGPGRRGGYSRWRGGGLSALRLGVLRSAHRRDDHYERELLPLRRT